MQFHIITKSDGSGGASEDILWDNLRYANEEFKSAGIEFYHCDTIKYIHDNEYYESGIVNSTLGDTLYYENAIDSVINVFVAGALGGLASGAAAYPQSKFSAVFLRNDATYTNKTFIHELGHYFGLFHTHHNGNERADGSNCDRAGDYVCDTPADPGLQSNGTVDADCKYTGPATDSYGTPYAPLTDNPMSYGRDYCQNHFTEEQYAHMAYVAEWVRFYLKGCPERRVGFEAVYTPSCDLPLSVNFLSEADPFFPHFWDFDGDGAVDDTTSNPTFVYENPGSYDVCLKVFDGTDTVALTKRKAVVAGSRGMFYKEDFEGFVRKYLDVYADTNAWPSPIDGWTSEPKANFWPADPPQLGWRCDRGLNSTVKNDHTLKNALGQFMMWQTWPGGFGDTSYLTSPCIAVPQNVDNALISFWYLIAGNLTDETPLHIDLYDGSAWCLDYIPALVGTMGTPYDSSYKQASFNVSELAGKDIKIRFRTLKSTEVGSVAIDDFLFWTHSSLALIRFEEKEAQVDEDMKGDGCGDSSAYWVVYEVSDTVQGEAATLHLSATGSATLGRDFSLPLQEVTLPNGFTGRDSFPVQILYDRAPESDETVELRFSLNGTSNAILNDSLITITIRDNDAPPDPNGLYGRQAILWEDFSILHPAEDWVLHQDTGSTGWRFQLAENQNILGQAPPGNQTWVAGTGNVDDYKITNQDYLVTPELDFSGLGNVTLSFDSYGYAAYSGIPGYLVEASTVSPYGPWEKVVWATPSYVWRQVETDLSDFAGEEKVWVAFHYQSDHQRISHWLIDNVEIEGEGTAPIIADILGQLGKANLGPYETISIFSQEDELLASIKNLSGHDFGCVSVEVDRVGNSAVPFQTNLSKDMLASRTLFAFAEYPDLDSTVNITLYFTVEEINGWEEATGNDGEELKIVQSPFQIALVTPQTPNVNGINTLASDNQYGDYGQNAGYYISGTINGGFGGLGIGANLVDPVYTYEYQNFDYRLKIFPNPGSDEISFKLGGSDNHSGIFKVQLSDVLGHRAISQEFTDFPFSLNTSALLSGIWLVTISHDGVILAHGKFIKG